MSLKYFKVLKRKVFESLEERERERERGGGGGRERERERERESERERGGEGERERASVLVGLPLCHNGLLESRNGVRLPQCECSPCQQQVEQCHG